MKRYIRSAKVDEVIDRKGDYGSAVHLVRLIRQTYPDLYYKNINKLSHMSEKELRDLLIELELKHNTELADDYADVAEFIENHKDNVVCDVNDSTDLQGDDFRAECAERMEDLLACQFGYDAVISYLVKRAFAGYGENI